MAELGTIDFTDLERGTVRPSEGREVTRGLGQTLDAIGQIHVADVLGEFTDQAQDIISESRETAGTATVFDAPSSLSGEEGRIQRRAGLLKAQIERGNSSQRALAQLKLKQLLNEAQMARPALAQHLQQQLGNIVTSSAKLDEIGLIDSINEENAKSAQAQLKAMVDHGTGLVENGGLGIDPSIPPHSAEFARQYAARQQARNIEQLHQLNVQLAATSSDMSAREKSQRVTAALVGHGNLINSTLNRYANDIATYRAELAKGPDKWNAAYMENFAVNVRPAMVEELNFKKLELMQSLDVIFPSIEERTSEYYGQVSSQFDDVAKHVDALIAGVSGTDLRAMDHVIAANRIRANDYIRTEMPEFQRFNMLFNPENEGVQPFLETLAKFDLTGQSLIGTQRIANTGLGLIGPLLEGVPQAEWGAAVLEHTYMNGGQGKITDTSSPREIKNTLRGNWSGTSGNFYGRNQTENDDLRMAIADLEMYRQKAGQAVESKSPFTAGQFMTTATNAVLVMDTIGNPGTQQVELTESMLGDPVTFEASLLDGNGANKNRRIALGEAADEFLANTEINARKQRYKQQLERPVINGVPLKNFLEFRLTDDVEQADGSTQFTFTVRRDYLRQQMNATPGITTTDAQVRLREQELVNQVLPVVQKINTQIRAMAHIDAWKQPDINESTVDYVNAADNEGWVDYLFPQGN